MNSRTQAPQPRFYVYLVTVCQISLCFAAALAEDATAPTLRTTVPGDDIAASTTAAGATTGVPCGSDTLTQSNDPHTIDNDSVWCGTLALTVETSHGREFVAANDLLLECVEFGVRRNTGADWPVQVRILQGPISTPYAQLVELGTTTVQIPAGTNSQFFTANLTPIAIDAGTTFVVELRTPSRRVSDGGDGEVLSLACNELGETAPSYFRAPECGANEFLTFHSIGFGYLSAVMTLGVETDICYPCHPGHDPPSANEITENETPCTNSLNGGCDFDTVNPPFMQLGGANCGVCGTLWADDTDMDRDWYFFDVPGTGSVPVSLTLFGSTSSGILCEVYSGTGTCGTMSLVPGGRFDHRCGGSNSAVTQVLTLNAPARYYVRVLAGSVLHGHTLPRPTDNCAGPFPNSANYRLTVSGVNGCLETGELYVLKYQDNDCNGVHDPGEPGLSGWEIIVTNNDTGAQINGMTGSGGGFFTNPLPYGDYTVTEKPSSGFRAPCQAVQVTIDSPDAFSNFASIGNCPCPASDFGVDLVCGSDWQVVATPAGVPGNLPRPAVTVSPHSAWDPNDCWMSAAPNGNVSLPGGDYVYEYCFCLDERFSNPVLNLCVKADDSAAVYVNGVFIGNGISFDDPGCGTVMTNDPLLFRPGQNCIQIVVNNAFGPTGLSVFGSMQATDGQCCFDECPCVPPPANMTGWWTLDEESGATAFDDAGTANDGSHNGAPALAAGRVAAARQYNGTSDFTEVANAAELNPGTGEFSIDAWIRTTSTSSYQMIVSKKYFNNTSGLDSRGFDLALENGTLRFDLATGPTIFDQETFLYAGPNLADGRWHFVAATVRREDPFGVKLYVDGVPQAFGTAITGSLSNASVLRIGARTSTPDVPLGDFFAGAIDEVEYFQRAITPAEVWKIWRAGSNGKCRTIWDIGDLNCDGTVSVGDIGAFVLALTDPNGYETQFPDCEIINADINRDGVVTVGDIGFFVALLTG